MKDKDLKDLYYYHLLRTIELPVKWFPWCKMYRLAFNAGMEYLNAVSKILNIPMQYINKEALK